MKIPTNSLDFAAPIAAFGLGIADAQNALNAVSIKLARTIAGLDVHAPKIETPSGRTYNPVSYTHLTLPTICSV